MNEDPPHDSSPKRSLSLFDCVCIIVGTIIGAGIFSTPSSIAKTVPNEFWMIAMWCIGGAVALVGAMCFAELTTTYPDRGGDYGYLKRAFGRWVGFAFSWAAFWVIRPGNISVMTIVFGIYAQDAFSNEISKVTYALLALATVSGVNLLGLKAGKWSQNLLTVAKVAGILLILLASLMFVPKPSVESSTKENLGTAIASDSLKGEVDSKSTLLNEDKEVAEVEGGESKSEEGWFWLALVFVMFAFGGWNDIAFVAGEVHQPQRNLFRSLILGTLAVLGIYLFFNIALLVGLGQESIASHEYSNAPTEFIKQRLGDIGGRLLATLVCVSCVGAVSAMIFTSPRIYWATAIDYPSLKWLAGTHDGNGWRRSMMIQTIVTAIFILVFGRYDDSFDLMVIASAPYFWGFLALTVLALIVLRFRNNASQAGEQFHGGYRTPLFPVLPIVFIVVCLFMTYRTLSYMVFKGFLVHAVCIGLWILLGVIASLNFKTNDANDSSSND